MANLVEASDVTALIAEDGSEWTFPQVQQPFESLPNHNLFGRVGVLTKDHFLSGLASGAVIREATCVPLDPKMTLPEVQEQIDLLDLSTLVIASDDWPDLRIESQVRVQLKDGKLRWVGEFQPGKPSEDALVLIPSGSTGTPKTLSLSHENLIQSTAAIISSIHLTKDDRAINMLPMAHIGGLVDLFLVPMICGGSVVFADPKTPQEILQAISKQTITWLQGASAILQSLIRARRNCH